MKIYSWNVNGIRSAWGKGLQEWLESESPEIVCLQEVKAKEDQFPTMLSSNNLFVQDNYNLYTNCAQRPGYAGVAVLSREPALKVEKKLGLERFDTEGRMLKLEFKDFVLFNFYIRHGGRYFENIEYKMEVYRRIFEMLDGCKDKQVILCGDFNIAHDERDLARPKQNIKNIMFTIDERRKIDKLESLGFTDTLRMFKFDNGHYTWWPYMANARERNLGWRIDYIWVSENLKNSVMDAFVRPDILGSDHGPTGIKISI